LTDTPIKKKGARGKSATEKRKRKLFCDADTKLTASKNKKIRQDESSDSEEDETFCLICCDDYSNSVPGEKWVQYQSCRGWAHEQCTDGSEMYYWAV
jgi:hypothetical protein